MNQYITAVVSLLLILGTYPCVRATDTSIQLLPPIVGGIDYGVCYLMQQQPAKPFEYCPDADLINGVSNECRVYWMAKALAHQLEGIAEPTQRQCPISIHSSILVDHSDTSPGNHKDSRGRNCGILSGMSNGARHAGNSLADSPESDAVRSVADYAIGQARNKLFWNKYSQYSTVEPSAAAAAQQVQLGIKEVIYGVRTGELIDLGYPAMRQSAIQAAKLYYAGNNGQSQQQQIPLVYMGQMMREQILPYLKWQNNATFPCPPGCVKYPHGVRCRMP